MASKKDLVEGQAFSRRRLITAFVSGAPGGREVEPGKPLRAVVGGVVLSAILVVGALAAGLLAPTLPDGWDQGSLVIAKDTGARYVALDGTLYPVVNTASARLLIPSGFKVVSADADKLTGSKRGPTLGINGAPDALPGPDDLVDTGWTACTNATGGLETSIRRAADAVATTDKGVIATVTTGTGVTTYLLDSGTRYTVPPELVTPLKRALRLDTAPDFAVSAPFVNLFGAGPAIGPFTVPGAGTSLAGVDGLPNGARIGSIVEDSGNPGRPYLLLDGGAIAPLTPFAQAMYRIGAEAGAADALGVSGSVFAGLGRADAVWPQAWPTEVPAPLGGTPCALLTAGTGGTKPAVALAVSDRVPTATTRTTVVDPGAGALVRAIGAASLTNGPVFLVDQTGVAFPVEGTSEENPIVKLGYADTDIVPVPQAWVALLDTGKTLSVTAASTVIASANGR